MRCGARWSTPPLLFTASWPVRLALPGWGCDTGRGNCSGRRLPMNETLLLQGPFRHVLTRNLFAPLADRIQVVQAGRENSVYLREQVQVSRRSRQTTACVAGHLPLPVALRNEEISEEDIETLFRIAEDPEAQTGVLRRQPRKIP